MHRACTVTPMEQEGFTPLSRRPVRSVRRGTGQRSSRYEHRRRCVPRGPEWRSEGRAVDKDAVNDGPDRGGTVPVDDSRHLFVEMPVVVIRTGMLRALEYEFDHIVDGCVLGIPGSFTNVVEPLESDISSPWGVRPSVSRRWLQSSLLANPSKGIFERNRGPAAGKSISFWMSSPVFNVLGLRKSVTSESVGRDHR